MKCLDVIFKLSSSEGMIWIKLLRKLMSHYYTHVNAQYHRTTSYTLTPFKSHGNTRAFVYITAVLSEPRIKVRWTEVLVRANLVVSNKRGMKMIFLVRKGPFLINKFLIRLIYSSSTSPKITDTLQHSTAKTYIIRDHIHSVVLSDQFPSYTVIAIYWYTCIGLNGESGWSVIRKVVALCMMFIA
jgi:hypothetical protein